MTPIACFALRLAHLLQFLSYEFGRMPGGFFTESKAFVHPGIERFCELFRLKAPQGRIFIKRLMDIALGCGCQHIDCSCKAGKIDDQQENEFGSPAPHKDSPFPKKPFRRPVPPSWPIVFFSNKLIVLKTTDDKRKMRKVCFLCC